MSTKRKGFTLIEVAIFLAVTGFLFAMVTIGVQNSIYQQRYNDTIQSYVDFLQNIYAEAANVESLGNGKHDEAIYGKMVSFGQTVDLEGAQIQNGKQSIFVYDVIAKAVNSGELGPVSNTLEMLKQLGANVVRKNSDGKYEAVGIIEDYMPKWSAKIQKTDAFQNYTGTILVVRNPSSGVLHTFVSNDVIEVNEMLRDSEGSLNVFQTSGGGNRLDSFGVADANFCINPNGDESDRNRVNVRLLAGSHNSSGVETIFFDSEDNKCNNNGE